MSFTSGDRVLLHLLMKSNRKDWTGGVADQDDIAAYCGIGRTHVPRALKPLISDGLVEETQGRAPGRARRVKVYSLTPAGVASAVALRDRANELLIVWTDDTDASQTEPCVDALRRINDRLGAASLSQIPISLFLTVGKSRITWNEILFLSSTVKSEEAGDLELPKGWKPLTPPEVPETAIEREGEMARLSELVRENEISAIVGARGSGKRTLVAMLAERSGTRALWLASEGDSEYNLDPGSYDILVLVGAPVLDVASTLIGGGRTRLRDPRDEDWPEPLMSLPVLGIMDGELDVEGDAVMALGGLSEADFLQRALETGISEDLAREYFRASRGLPGALVYLEELGSGVLRGLETLDLEAALMSLMLGLRSRS
ncbi:MAG: hypothetical protein ACMUHU_02940 [Thermoplasmatota archaeon]